MIDRLAIDIGRLQEASESLIDTADGVCDPKDVVRRIEVPVVTWDRFREAVERIGKHDRSPAELLED